MNRVTLVADASSLESRDQQRVLCSALNAIVATCHNCDEELFSMEKPTSDKKFLCLPSGTTPWLIVPFKKLSINNQWKDGILCVQSFSFGLGSIFKSIGTVEPGTAMLVMCQCIH